MYRVLIACFIIWIATRQLLAEAKLELEQSIKIIYLLSD